jgi:hypothetical protein
MARSIRICRRLEKVLEPNRLLFKELKVKKQAAPHHSFCAKKIKALKKSHNIVLGGRSIILLFAGGFGTYPREKRGIDVYNYARVSYSLFFIISCCSLL